MNVSGANTLLIAAWHSEYDFGFPDGWRVEYNGVAGTLLTDTNGYRGGDGNRRFRTYCWTNPPAGLNTLLVTNDLSYDNNELAISAILLTNVTQIAPIGGIGFDVSTNNRTGESETVSTTTNDLVLHVIADELYIRGVLGSGETSRSVANDGKHVQDGDASLWISTKPGGDSSTTVSSSGWASYVINGVAMVVHGFVGVSPPPVAGFAGSPTSGIAPLSVSFTNLSSGATNYAWVFGDGNVSASANPVNTYTNPGVYSVSLTAFGSGGTDTLTLSNYIVVAAPPPVAGFVGSPTSGIAPLLVSFTNLSSGGTDYAWAFGDGNVSASANPVNTYTNPGVYSVSLTAIGAGGTDTLTLSNYIVVGASSPATLLSALVSNGQFSLSFDTVASQSYTIQENTNFLSTNWVTVTNFLGTGSTCQFNTPATNTRSPVFFRVREP